MKRLIILLFVLPMCLLSNAQEELFKRYENTKGVETVFISKSLLSMMPDMQMGNMEIGKVAGKIDRIQVLTCERADLIDNICNYAISLYKRGGYEEMMRTNESGEKTYIYQKRHGKKNEFVILDIEKNELNIVNLFGTTTLKDIKGISD
jgi:hypothetical protein